MGLPRSKYVDEGKPGIYHCVTRCVRRAFLSGYDSRTGRDFSHRKVWISDRLQFLATIFAVEVATFSVMDNHYHVPLRIRPDITARWSDLEVATRWLTLCPKRYRSKKKAEIPLAEQIHNLSLRADRIAVLRKRLCSLSWFMKHLNEFIARAANKEDGVKGRFWESRFKCQHLLDEAAIAACMVYVDLNPIRAGMALTPEQSDFTGIQVRIRACRRLPSPSVPAVSLPASSKTDTSGKTWLCPIESKTGQDGILPMSEEEYFDLVDRSGRIIRSNKRGSIDANLAPILKRIGAKPESWQDTVSNFGTRFILVAGMLSNLRNYAERIGSKWLSGLSAANRAFESS